MKTPYDVLSRLRRRELDEQRRKIAEAEDTLGAAHAAVCEVEARGIAAAGPAAGLPLLDFSSFRTRLVGMAHEAAHARASAEGALDDARTKGLAAFIDAKAVDLAAESYIEAQLLQRARAEQALLDEVAARRRP